MFRDENSREGESAILLYTLLAHPKHLLLRELFFLFLCCLLLGLEGEGPHPLHDACWSLCFQTSSSLLSLPSRLFCSFIEQCLPLTACGPATVY